MKEERPRYQRSDVAHGVMFHHFAGGKHAGGQGAIDAEALDACLEFVGADRIVPAAEWIWKVKRGRLEERDLCLTFDDGLACQFEIALPVLRARKLTAFWFVYTEPYQGKPGMLEVYRVFRNQFFGSVEEFYEAFYEMLDSMGQKQRAEDALRGYDPGPERKAHPYYSEADLRFRFVRDSVLTGSEYATVMEQMMIARGADALELAKGLWMAEEDLARLVEEEHEVGLHSHTHSTVFGQLNWEAQRREYQENYGILRDITGKHPVSVAHPCNSYDERTLAILKELGVVTGFRANMEVIRLSALEVPRQDHANLVSMMREEA